MNAETEKKRIVWVDILRFLGMTLIYWGHLGTSGNVTLYIFAHHVPLFFFISGFFAGLSPSEGSFPAYLWKKVRSLVLPYLVFTLLFYALSLLTGQLLLSDLPKALLVSAAGVRNRVPGPLWFFPCLFLITILFELAKRVSALIFKDRKAAGVLPILFAALLYLCGILFLGHEPAQDPRWIWNADSAMVYLLYYALGALFFPKIREFRFSEKSEAKRVAFFLCFVASLAFALVTLLMGEGITGFVSEAVSAPLFEVYGLFSALILIFFELCLSRFLALIPGIRSFLAYIGKDSLYLCGNELIIKYFGSLAVSALGLQGLLASDLGLLLYSILCMIVLTFTLNLGERLLFGPLFGSGQLRLK